MIWIKAYRGRRKVFETTYSPVDVSMTLVYELIDEWRRNGCEVRVYYPPITA